MRIVNLDEFLQMPVGTVYSKYVPCVFGDICIFEGRVSEDTIDFYYRPVSDLAIANNDPDFDAKVEASEKGSGESIELSFNNVFRDGLFNTSCLFAVLETKDFSHLVNSLNILLKNYKV